MNKILNKKSVKKVTKLIKDFDSNLETIYLEKTARTAQDAATALGCNVGAIVKSLLFRSGNDFVLCLVSGDKKCSLNKLKKILNEKNVSLAKPDDVKKVTGYTIGGVSPIGHLRKIKILVDYNLERFKDLFAAAGHQNCVFKIQFEKLIDLTSGEIKAITE